jgi:phenylacetate-CoA ligase
VSYPVRRRLVSAFLHGARPLRRGTFALRNPEVLLRPRLVPALERVGAWRAWIAFEEARRDVPAYRRFLEEHGGGDVVLRGLDPDLSTIPITDKENYVRRYSVESRCRGGHLPRHGVVIDESSGTSGEPSNWVRGPEERADGRKLLQLGLRRAFGHDPLFVVNAFALGPWATGMNVSMASVDVAVLKSVGPDIAKIEATLRLFGPRYRYLVCGYPPFLKALVDRADLDWDRYECAAVVGGEGMSEALRSHLLRFFDRVYSSFGASDLEINIAAENDFTIPLRRLVAERQDLREALALPSHPSLPMVFQYNPLDYYVETSADGELVFTICRLRTAAPKIRYNLHDLGVTRRFGAVLDALAETGVRPEDVGPRSLDLPLLFHYGRADATVAYYGANIAPADIDEALLSVPSLARCVSSFALVPSEDGDGGKRLAIAFELRAGAEAPAPNGVRDALLERLAAVNQDYREAARFMPPDATPTLEFHAAGTGPFEGYDPRLKRRYVQPAQ